MRKKCKDNDAVVEDEIFILNNKYYCLKIYEMTDAQSCGYPDKNKSSIIGPLDSIVVHKTDEDYIIDDYSKGVCKLFNHNQITGKDILKIMPDTLSPEILKSAIDKTTLSIDCSAYCARMTIDEINYNIYLFVIPMILKDEAKVLINLRYIKETDNMNHIPQFPAQNDIYYDNNLDCIKINSEQKNQSKEKVLLSYFEKLQGQNNIGKSNAANPIEDNHDILTESGINKKVLEAVTNREREIILMVLEGNTNKYISVKLSITEGTVKKTLHNAYRKLGISSRIELAKLLLKD